MNKKTVLFTTLFLSLIFLIGCSQPVAGEVGSSSEDVTISFNYNLIGAFEQQGSRSNEQQSSRSNQHFFDAKMKVTNLATTKVAEYDWIVMLEPALMTVTSYSSLLLEPGSYRFELIMNSPEYSYYGKSGAITVKKGSNTIPLTITPVIGATEGTNVTSENISNLSINFSTIELDHITNPRLGYRINGGTETIITLNKASGFSVLSSTKNYKDTLQLKLYDGRTLVGINRDSGSKIFPIHGEGLFSLPISGGAGQFSFVIPPEVFAKIERGGVDALEVMLTVRGPNNPPQKVALTSAIDAAGVIRATGTVEGLINDRVHLNLDLAENYKFPTGPNSYGTIYSRIAHATIEDVELNSSNRTVAVNYNIFTGSHYNSKLRAMVNLSVMNSHGHPITGYNIRVVGDNYIDAGTTNWETGSVLFDVTPGERRIELFYGKEGPLLKAFNLSLKPLDIKNITYKFPASGVWTEVDPDSFTGGEPLPFDVVRRGSTIYRIREQESLSGRTITLEMPDAAKTGWMRVGPSYSLSAGEVLYDKKEPENNIAIDSKGTLYIAPQDSNGNITHLMRLKSNYSGWFQMPLPADATPYKLLTNRQGELFIACREKARFIQKLKSDGSGWMDCYPAPSTSYIEQLRFDNEDRLHMTIGHDFYRYEAATGGWKMLTDMSFIYDERDSYYKFNSLNEAIFISNMMYYNDATATSGNKYTRYYVSVKKMGTGSSYKWGETLSKAPKNNPIKLNSFTLMNGDIYALIDGVGGRPEIYRVDGSTLKVKPAFSEDMPVMGSGFKARIASGRDGKIYLNYYNETKGLSITYKR